MSPILIVEDDPHISEIYQVYLARHGYQSLLAHSGLEGLRLAEQHPDLSLAIIDVMLPELNGFEVCRRIRALSAVPILMITARARSNSDIVRALDAGADDYLLKPVDLPVLLAHVRALLRRPQLDSGPSYQDNRLQIDGTTRQVQVEGQPLRLSDLEERLLWMLLEQKGRVAATWDICDALWPGADYDAARRSLYVYIARLRQLIEADPGQPRYIVTERSLGYRFEG